MLDTRTPVSPDRGGSDSARRPCSLVPHTQVIQIAQRLLSCGGMQNVGWPSSLSMWFVSGAQWDFLARGIPARSVLNESVLNLRHACKAGDANVTQPHACRSKVALVRKYDCCGVS